MYLSIATPLSYFQFIPHFLVTRSVVCTSRDRPFQRTDKLYISYICYSLVKIALDIRHRVPVVFINDIGEFTVNFPRSRKQLWHYVMMTRATWHGCHNNIMIFFSMKTYTPPPLPCLDKVGYYQLAFLIWKSLHPSVHIYPGTGRRYRPWALACIAHLCIQTAVCCSVL